MAVEPAQAMYDACAARVSAAGLAARVTMHKCTLADFAGDVNSFDGATVILVAHSLGWLGAHPDARNIKTYHTHITCACIRRPPCILMYAGSNTFQNYEPTADAHTHLL